MDATIEKRMVVGKSDNFTEDLEQHLSASGADLLIVPWRAQAYSGMTQDTSPTSECILQLLD